MHPGGVVEVEVARKLEDEVKETKFETLIRKKNMMSRMMTMMGRILKEMKERILNLKVKVPVVRSIRSIR